MPIRLIERARDLSRRRFVVVSVLLGVGCIALLVLDGLSAAVHFHVGVAVFGVAFFVVLLFWFRVVEARTKHFRRDRRSD
ncbi:MAG: hypothetical protein M3R65_08975 [Gemmatimonadota bacterium]|nr:hypothetical protein [Gemmatimonadota bacterium]